MLFGATRLADLGGSLGKGIKEFRKNVKDDEAGVEEEAASSVPSTAPSAQTAEKVMDTPEAISALKCPQCGTLNPIGARHCSQCGASIAAPVS
jgi:Sec-independent protein translocase protein TatA